MPTSPFADTEVAEYAGQLFFRLWRASHLRVADALGSIDLTPPRFALLNLLGARDGSIQQEIASSMGIDPSTLVALIDALEAAGLAERRPRPSDRRAREVAITPAGRRLLDRGREMAAEVDDEVLRRLTAAERRELMKLLRKALSSAPPQPPWTAAEDD